MKPRFGVYDKFNNKAEGRQPDQFLQAAVLEVLTAPPAVMVPADFAARVALRATSQPRSRPAGWADVFRVDAKGTAPRVAAVSGVLLLGALFAFAPHTRPSVLDLRFDVELLLLVELGGVGYLVARTGLGR